jgi:hypothetical protein
MSRKARVPVPATALALPCHLFLTQAFSALAISAMEERHVWAADGHVGA